MVRKATIYDIDDIYNLGILVNKNFKELFNMNEILNEKFSKVFVYEDKGNIVGFMHVTKLYEVMDVLNIVVKENMRRKKIGTNLLDYAISDCLDIKLITLEVSVNNEPAISFYKKFGFEVISVRKKYYDDGDAYLMGRSI